MGTTANEDKGTRISSAKYPKEEEQNRTFGRNRIETNGPE